MGDDGRGRTELAVDPLEDLEDEPPGLEIEGAGGLVAEEDVGTLRHGAGDGDALLLAARELGREVVEAVAEADEPERVGGVERVLGDVRHERDVLARREARDQVVELEDEPDVLAAVRGEERVVLAREVVIGVVDVAGRRHVEPAQDVEQRRLPAPGGAEQRDELAGVELEVDAAERDHVDLAHAVDLRDAAGTQDRRDRRHRDHRSHAGALATLVPRLAARRASGEADGGARRGCDAGA